MYTDRWDPKTKQGKARHNKLLEILKCIKYREELRMAVLKEPLFKGISIPTVLRQLDRMTTLEPESPLAKAWAAVVLMPHLAIRTFPNEARRAAFKRDCEDPTMLLDEIEKRYPEYKALPSFQQCNVRRFLEIKRPFSGVAARIGKKQAFVETAKPAPTAPWWERLTQEQKQEFLADYQKDCRVVGNTNDDIREKWAKITGEATSAESLRKAARALGETRNRLQISHEYKNSEESESAIAARLAELVRMNILIGKSPEEICAQVQQEFSANPAYARYAFTEERFKDLLDQATWTPGAQGTLAALKEFVSSGTPLERFHKHHLQIPFEVVKAKAQQLVGETNAKHPMNFGGTRATPGVLRFLGEEGLKGGEDFELPASSPSHPYETGITGASSKVRHLNAPNLGLLHERDIEVNPPRRALAQAQYEGYDGVVLTNVFTLNTTKAAGPSRVLKALFEGLHVDEDDVGIFDPSYQEKVVRIIKEHPDDEVFYQTHEEMLRDLVRGLRKVLLKPGGESGLPEFSGPIWYVLGKPEELIIITATYWHVHFITRIKQSDIRAELKAAESALGMVMTDINPLALDVRRELHDAKRRLETETDSARQEEARQSVAGLEQQLAGLITSGEIGELEGAEREVENLRAEEARTRISTVATQEWKRFYQKALAGFVRLVTHAVPNCNLKVIGKGTTYIKVGSERREINIPGHDRITDRHLSAYTDVYGGRVLRGEMADFVVICPQYSLNMSLTGREVDNDGKRGSAIVSVAPMCVNAGFLRESLKTIVHKTAHPIGKTVFSEQCQTGVLDVITTNGITTTSYVSVSALGTYERAQAFLKLSPVEQRKNRLMGKVIRIAIATDQHWGSQAKEFLRCHECGVNLGMMDAVFHMWRKAGYGNGAKLPLCHFCLALDDPTQGHHFDAEHQPHPHELLYPDIEKLLRTSFEEFRKTRGLAKRLELEELLVKRIEYQFLIRGVYCTTNQMMLLLKQHLQPNIDMYDGILRRAVDAGLILRGISQFLDRTKVIKDSRDVGFVVMGTGNHFLKTTEGTVSEGPIYAELIKAHLLQQPYWQERAELVEQYVRGPVYGKELISFGTVQAPGGYEWGLDFRNTPPGRGVDWGSPLRACSQNDLRRGNYSRIFEKKMAVKAYGDKHFLSNIITSNAIYIMGPASTHTDVYGELGFPPNNTGVVFLDIPAEGPNAGPISIRQLLYDEIRDLVAGGWRTFDWEKFLPNAL